jgi:hypothetical protein
MPGPVLGRPLGGKGGEYEHDAQASGLRTHLLAPRACVCRIQSFTALPDESHPIRSAKVAWPAAAR